MELIDRIESKTELRQQIRTNQCHRMGQLRQDCSTLANEYHEMLNKISTRPILSRLFGKYRKQLDDTVYLLDMATVAFETLSTILYDREIEETNDERSVSD